MQNNALKIAIIIPYYGIWPNYMNIFFASCNEGVPFDIIFITDLEPHKNSPENIKYHHLSFADLKQLISQKTDCELQDIAPYKLCDIRPAYGIIFSELLKDYDFWGYGDNDLIFGNVNQFLTAEDLKNHDILCFRSDHLHGPLTIYRNVTEVNELFKKSPYWKSIFSAKDYRSFDEFGKELFHLKVNQELKHHLPDNISVLALNASESGELRLYMQHHSKEVIADSKEHIHFKDGQVLNAKNQEQYAFYHWVIEKRALWFKYPNWQTVPSSFFVTESGFYTPSEYRIYGLINAYRKTTGTIKWLYLKGTNYIKRKLGKKVVWDTYPRLGFVKKL
jgi:hypothetical protein